MSSSNTSVNVYQAFYKQRKQLDFVLPGLLRGTVGAIVAPGSVGKGFFALELCVLVSSLGNVNLLGIDLPNSPTYSKPYPDDIVSTLFITAEDPVDIVEDRLISLGQFIDNENRERVGCCMEVHSFLGLSPHLVNKEGERVEKWIDCLKRGCIDKDLCIIDTLSLFHNGTENDEGNMKLLIEILKEIAVQTNCCMLFTHHIPKRDYSDDEPASRGSSVLVNNIRWQINLRNMSISESDNRYNGEKPWLWVKVLGSKINYAAKPESGEDIWLKRDLETGVLLRAEPERKADKGGNGNGKSF